MSEEEKRAAAAPQPETPAAAEAEQAERPGQPEAPAAPEAPEAAKPAKAAETAEAAPAEAPAEAKPDGGQPPADAKAKKEWFKGKAREAEGLKAKLEAAEKKADEIKDQLLRTAAEYENFRKRSAREADRKFSDGVSHAVTQILPILDTLDMAANAACADENYKKGVVMTLDKAAQALTRLNITEIEALGKPFDPNLMNAVQQVPAAEGQESGTVVQVYQKGYKIGDIIIRHASVVVAE